MDAWNSVIFEAVDQRAEARSIDGDGDGMAICDIGAYEAPMGGQSNDNDNV